jgi:hypothetical protein
VFCVDSLHSTIFLFFFFSLILQKINLLNNNILYGEHCLVFIMNVLNLVNVVVVVVIVIVIVIVIEHRTKALKL